MQVSKDRINWKILSHEWYLNQGDRSIFASNSDVIKFNDIAIPVSGSGNRAVTGDYFINSRVVNVSGLVIGSDAEDCRVKVQEIAKDLNYPVLWFYDEYYKKVFRGFIPNINHSLNRGKYSGRTCLVNFNVTLMSPYLEELEESVVIASSEKTVTFVNKGEETPYWLKYKPNTYPFVVNKLFDGLEFTENITLSSGQWFEFDTRGESYKADICSVDGKTSILTKVKDDFWVDMELLKSGLNTLEVGTANKDIGYELEIRYFERSI